MIYLKIFLVVFLLFSLWRLWVTSRDSIRKNIDKIEEDEYK